jgi:hypothetical protein
VSRPLGGKCWIDCSFHLARDDGGEILRAWTISSYAFSPLVVTIENKEKRRRAEGSWKVGLAPCSEIAMPLLLERP